MDLRTPHFTVRPFASALLGLALLSSVACQAIAPQQNTQNPPSTNQSPPSASAPSAPAPAPIAGDLQSSVRQIAQQVRPAVVHITNQQSVANSLGRQPLTVPAGVGSGVIYDPKGYILTNAHVIADANSLLVALPDGRSFPAKLLGSDPQTDLAVLQINADNLPVARLGDSKQLQIGDWVVAIGNALGLSGGPTVTTGVVGALGRTVQEPGSGNGTGPYLFDLVQTDASINPGNSGGPLVNLAGEVIGINTMVAGMAEPGVPAQGIGFAIAIDTAKPIADQLVTLGRAIHPYIGISYAPVSSALASQIGIQTGNRTSRSATDLAGIVIGQVMPGSPAASAGLRQRDVVTAIDGKQLEDESSLAQIINKKKPGDTITMSVVRANQTTEVKVTLGEMPPA
jgi:serine protease Do